MLTPLPTPPPTTFQSTTLQNGAGKTHPAGPSRSGAERGFAASQLETSPPPRPPPTRKVTAASREVPGFSAPGTTSGGCARAHALASRRPPRFPFPGFSVPHPALRPLAALSGGDRGDMELLKPVSENHEKASPWPRASCPPGYSEAPLAVFSDLP